MKIITNVPFPSQHPGLSSYDLEVTFVEDHESHVENYKNVMSDYDVWIEMDPIKITREVIEAGKNLKWIHVGRVGFDGADLEAIKERGIILTNSKGCNHIPISEDVILKMLMLSRDSYRYFSHHQEKKWAIHVDQPLTRNADDNMQILSRSAFTLLGKTVGILGTGMIGKEIARRVKSFGTLVCGYNRSGRSVEG
jgi:phosphoglycerate dehydrogenase-like enzyme